MDLQERELPSPCRSLIFLRLAEFPELRGGLLRLPGLV